MATIGDSLGIVYRGAEANYSTPGREAHSHSALVHASNLPAPAPITGEPTMDISNMLSKQGSGSPGDNLDVYA